MTMYRLRDKERQKALEIALPEFATRFQKACEELRTSSAIYVTGNAHVWAVAIPVCEIEEILDYDPHGWNAFPDVEPPEDILMRVERSDGKKQCASFYYFRDDGEGCWCDEDGAPWPMTYSKRVIRFRPWED